MKSSIAILVSIVSLASCGNYRETFHGKEPGKKWKPVHPPAVINMNTASQFSLRVCEGYGLYKEKQNVNNHEVLVAQEVPIRNYYNFDNDSICSDCILVEETYLMLDSFNLGGAKEGKLVYVAGHKTFNRFKMDAETGLDKEDQSQFTRSGDIRQYYSDEKKLLNLAVAFEMMQGRWMLVGENRLMLNIPNESLSGFYTVLADVSVNKKEILFKTITNPTIDKYSTSQTGNELAIDISSAIRFDNDTNGLTFHTVNPERKIIADFKDPGLHDEKIQRLEACISKLKTKGESKQKCINRKSQKISSLQKADNQIRQALEKAEEVARIAFRASTDANEKNELHKQITYAHWLNTHYGKSNFTVDSLEFGELKKRKKKRLYLKAWCSDYKVNASGQKSNSAVSVIGGDFRDIEKESQFLLEYFSLTKGGKKILLRKMIKSAYQEKIQDEEKYIEYMTSFEFQHTHNHHFKHHDKLYILK